MLQQLCSKNSLSSVHPRSSYEIVTAPLQAYAEQRLLPFLPMSSSQLKTFSPESPIDLLITASFGHLIPSRLIDLVGHSRALNVHPSLLPDLRGAAPIQWAIANGQHRTGVSVQELSKGRFDQGRLLYQREEHLVDGWTFGQAEDHLGKASGAALVKVLESFDRYQSAATHQSGTITFARKISNVDSRIQWAGSDVQMLLRRNRAFGHQYPLWATLAHQRVQLFGLQLGPIGNVLLEPGFARLAADRKSISIGCSTGTLQVGSLKREGGKLMVASNFWNGAAKGRETIRFD